MMHYHDYEIVGESPEAIVEVCKECKHRFVTRKGKDGRSNNKKWIEEHKRDTAQPTGATAKLFSKFYGKPKV